MKAATQHGAAVDAAVNEPGPVTLFARDGEEIQVAPEKVEAWLGRGFSRMKADPATSAAELLTALEAAKAPIQAFVEGVMADGVIDPSDEANQAAAYAAVEIIVSLWGRLVGDLARLYPVVQGEAVQLVKDGETIQVDPNQADTYMMEGWSRA